MIQLRTDLGGRWSTTAFTQNHQLFLQEKQTAYEHFMLIEQEE